METVSNILVDCSPLQQGGGVQVALAFLKFAKDDPSFRVSIIVPSTLYSLFYLELGEDISIKIVNKKSFLRKLFLAFYLKKSEREFDPDIVFTIFGPSYFKARAFHLVGFARGLMLYKNMVPNYQRSILSRVQDGIMLRLFRQADHLVVETETVSSRLTKLLNKASVSVTVIENSYNPIFSDALTTVGKIGPADQGKIILLVPSSWYLHKNLLSIPLVAAEMKRFEPELDFVFDFTLDQYSEGWGQLHRTALQLEVQDHIRPLGSLRPAALAQAYSASMLVYLPTLCESSTAVYPEAFFAGRALVTSDLDFARELCGDAALYIDPNDSRSTARRVVELIRSHSGQELLVQNGRRQLSEKYPNPAAKYQKQKALILKSIGLMPLS
jgi:glycosyltransferase involved in cell wall biosynthesis